MDNLNSSVGANYMKNVLKHSCLLQLVFQQTLTFRLFVFNTIIGDYFYFSIANVIRPFKNEVELIFFGRSFNF